MENVLSINKAFVVFLMAIGISIAANAQPPIMVGEYGVSSYGYSGCLKEENMGFIVLLEFKKLRKRRNGNIWAKIRFDIVYYDFKSTPVCVGSIDDLYLSYNYYNDNSYSFNWLTGLRHGSPKFFDKDLENILYCIFGTGSASRVEIERGQSGECIKITTDDCWVVLHPYKDIISLKPKSDCN